MADLTFYYGAMGCGKSAKLLQTAYNYKEKNKQIFIVKPSIDTKGDYKIISRNGFFQNTNLLLKDNELLSHYLNKNKKFDIIFVDEVQFCTESQIDDFYYITKKLNIPIYCYGLRCDFKMNGFKGATRLLQIADSIKELETICKCGNKATQILRLVNDIPVFSGDQIIIDNNDKIKYESVCGECYLSAKERSL